MNGFIDKNSPQSGPLCGMSDEILEQVIALLKRQGRVAQFIGVCSGSGFTKSGSL
jgi:hypothetical protein